MIATYDPSDGPRLNPISQWEDDGGAAPVASRQMRGATRAVNVGDAERILSVVAGGSLLVYGLARHSLSGLLTAIVGSGLVYRGVTGHCQLYGVLDVSTADDGVKCKTWENDASAEPQSGASLSSGPVEFRSSATPPMYATADDSSVVKNQKSDVPAASLPTVSKIEPAGESVAPPGGAGLPAAAGSLALHAPERPTEHTSGAEPQGRT